MALVVKRMMTMGMRKKNINQLCTDSTVTKDEFLLCTIILRLQMGMIVCKFFLCF